MKKKSGGSNTDYSERIRALRTATGLNQFSFAKTLGTARSMLAACESHENPRKPSVPLLVALGNLAANRKRYVDAKWFWGKAGINVAALDSVLDLHMREREADAGKFIEVSSFDESEKETIPFAARALPYPASTRFIRLANSEPPFGRGDIILVDTRSTNLLELHDGDLIAVGHGTKLFALNVGTLDRKKITESVTHFSIERPRGQNMFIASSEGKESPQMVSPLIGKVVAWIHGTGEHIKHRHWDREGFIAAAKQSEPPQPLSEETKKELHKLGLKLKKEKKS